MANQSQSSHRASMGKGNKTLYYWSRSHDQDGLHVHVYGKNIGSYVYDRYFQDLLQNHFANQSQIVCGASMEQGNPSLNK